jgi:hypothetical protein
MEGRFNPENSLYLGVIIIELKKLEKIRVPEVLTDGKVTKNRAYGAFFNTACPGLPEGVKKADFLKWH